MRVGRSLAAALVAIELETVARAAADTAHAAKKSAVHGVGAAYLAKTSVAAQTLSDAEIPDAVSRDLELANAIAAHILVTNAHHDKTVIGDLSPIAVSDLHGDVCTEAEADAKIAAAPAKYISLDVAYFQANPATGTSQTPVKLNDNDTGTADWYTAVGNYAEVDLGRLCKIKQWRQFGDDAVWDAGTFKLEYLDEDNVWHDWVTDIDARATADWSTWSVETVVIAHKIKMTCVTKGVSNLPCRELEVKY